MPPFITSGIAAEKAYGRREIPVSKLARGARVIADDQKHRQRALPGILLEWDVISG